jgi:hypothetical protein
MVMVIICTSAVTDMHKQSRRAHIFTEGPPTALFDILIIKPLKPDADAFYPP